MELEDIKVVFDSTDDISTTLDGGTIKFGELEIGTTTTGEAGSKAIVTNSGTSEHAVLNFTIPRGENGEQGKDGESGVYIGETEPTNANVWIVPTGKTDAIPTKTSELENDSGFITDYTETDPTVPTHVKAITESNINSWNNKSEFSGSYNDLTDTPTIPTMPTKTSQLENDSGFITKIPDEYAKKTDIPDVSSFITKEDVIEDVNTLTTNLEANKVYRGTINTNTTFVLPTITDNTKLHTIEIQVTISNYESITLDLGVTNKISDFELSDGTFIIYYEYLGEQWAVGVLPITTGS